MSDLSAAEPATLELVESYFAAETRLDVSEVLEHFHDDAVLVLPDGRRLGGRAAIAEFYAQAYAELAELDVRVVSAVTADGRAAVEWEASTVDRGGRAQTLRGVNIVRTRAGRFAELRVYLGPVS